MKPSALLRGTLLFLFFWNSSELEQAVISACSDDWLVVRMKRKPFGNDTEVQVGEIYLGNNCPVTKMLLSSYEFSYSVVSCGIKKIVFQESDAVILSKLRYKPTLQTTYEFEVLCFVKRLFIPSLLPFGMNGHDVNCAGNRSQRREVRPRPPAAASQDDCEPSLGTVSKLLQSEIIITGVPSGISRIKPVPTEIIHGVLNSSPRVTATMTPIL